jgi:hypothetical protein
MVCKIQIDRKFIPTSQRKMLEMTSRPRLAKSSPATGEQKDLSSKLWNGAIIFGYPNEPVERIRANERAGVMAKYSGLKISLVILLPD